jgi:hypothetical protein
MFTVPTCLLSLVAAICSTTPREVAYLPAVPSAQSNPVAHLATELQAAAEYLTKLRKLHLVRPDLINYPLVTDFVC